MTLDGLVQAPMDPHDYRRPGQPLVGKKRVERAGRALEGDEAVVFRLDAGRGLRQRAGARGEQAGLAAVTPLPAVVEQIEDDDRASDGLDFGDRGQLTCAGLEVSTAPRGESEWRRLRRGETRQD